jgi:flagellar hook assembly protein FlgD
MNLRGELVATVAEGDMGAGEHTATWGGTDAAGRPVSSGIYFYRLRAGGSLDTRKAILLK